MHSLQIEVRDDRKETRRRQEGGMTYRMTTHDLTKRTLLYCIYSLIAYTKSAVLLSKTEIYAVHLLHLTMVINPQSWTLGSLWELPTTMAVSDISGVLVEWIPLLIWPHFELWRPFLPSIQEAFLHIWNLTGKIKLKLSNWITVFPFFITSLLNCLTSSMVLRLHCIGLLTPHARDGVLYLGIYTQTPALYYHITCACARIYKI